jgi:hypothetical protein
MRIIGQTALAILAFGTTALGVARVWEGDTEGAERAITLTFVIYIAMVAANKDGADHER